MAPRVRAPRVNRAARAVARAEAPISVVAREVPLRDDGFDVPERYICFRRGEGIDLGGGALQRTTPREPSRTFDLDKKLPTPRRYIANFPERAPSLTGP